MVEVKGHQADAFLARPPADGSAVLIYGSDAGLVAERAQKLASAFADPSDPFALLKLDAGQVATDPSRLADEAYAVSMFGGRRAIVIRDGGSRPTLPGLIAPLLANPPPETILVVEAGDLKKTNALRALFEKDKRAHAIPCFEDDDVAVGRLIDEEARLAGLALAPDARSALIALLGENRLQSRGEVQKLCLYARGTGRIDLAAVEAIVGDRAGIAADEVVDAAATGQLDALSLALSRAATDGLDPGMLALATLRHFQMLDAARAEVDGGRGIGEVMKSRRPPIFYKREGAVTAALGLWTAPRIERALTLLADVVRDARLNTALARAMVEDVLITLARAAGQGRRR